MTISLVWVWRSTLKVESSSSIFCRAPEIFVWSAWLLGSTANPTIGRGNSIAASSVPEAAARVSDTFRSSILTNTTIWPATAWSTLTCSAPLTDSNWPILTALPMRGTWTDESFLSVPEKTRMKLIFDTKGSMRVLKTWATSGPPPTSIATSSPSTLALRAMSAGAREQLTRLPRNSSTPTSVLELLQKMGISVPEAIAVLTPEASSACESASPSRYRSINSSSASTIASINDWFTSVGSSSTPSGTSAGTSRVLITPEKSPPVPTGTFNGTQA